MEAPEGLEDGGEGGRGRGRGLREGSVEGREKAVGHKNTVAVMEHGWKEGHIGRGVEEGVAEREVVGASVEEV